ncbi:hypothetical protein [Modestobacter sp. NPDC049651]|uniref:hypothetical protein n=1 Tax=unclassified Modestobacter TaxID=2643866 RepID=UPI0034029518
MSNSMTIEPQGNHEYTVRLEGDGEVVESWFRVDPDVLADLGLPADDEEGAVRRTVDFLLRHQSVPDFPRMVELEDVVASYDDFREGLAAG